MSDKIKRHKWLWNFLVADLSSFNPIEEHKEELFWHLSLADLNKYFIINLRIAEHCDWVILNLTVNFLNCRLVFC